MQCGYCDQNQENLLATCLTCHQHFCNTNDKPASLSHILKHVKDVKHNSFSVPCKGILQCWQCGRNNIIDLFVTSANAVLCSEHKSEYNKKIVEGKKLAFFFPKESQSLYLEASQSTQGDSFTISAINSPIAILETNDVLISNPSEPTEDVHQDELQAQNQVKEAISTETVLETNKVNQNGNNIISQNIQDESIQNEYAPYTFSQNEIKLEQSSAQIAQKSTIKEPCDEQNIKRSISPPKELENVVESDSNQEFLQNKILQKELLAPETIQSEPKNVKTDLENDFVNQQTKVETTNFHPEPNNSLKVTPTSKISPMTFDLEPHQDELLEQIEKFCKLKYQNESTPELPQLSTSIKALIAEFKSSGNSLSGYVQGQIRAFYECENEQIESNKSQEKIENDNYQPENSQQNSLHHSIPTEQIETGQSNLKLLVNSKLTEITVYDQSNSTESPILTPSTTYIIDIIPGKFEGKSIIKALIFTSLDHIHLIYHPRIISKDLIQVISSQNTHILATEKLFKAVMEIFEFECQKNVFDYYIKIYNNNKMIAVNPQNPVKTKLKLYLSRTNFSLIGNFVNINYIIKVRFIQFYLYA